MMITRKMLGLLKVQRSNMFRSFSTTKAPFPSISITENGITAKGPFAQAQAHFLKPDMEMVNSLDALVKEKQLGIVAHFYMDPELQGVLSALKWPHTLIADSLAMGEAAAKMVRDGGVKAVAVLGVDFMSESVRANLNSHGFNDVPVYRLSEKYIGCSLAESAERQAYAAYLSKAAEVPNSLHVVYINTSLKSKAYAHNIIPTITCTSSNVVHTILQAFSQVKDLNLWYGPDTYMGENLYQMFEHIATLPNEKIKEIHPMHNQDTVKELLGRFDYFKEGNCVVHHMFGESVTNRVRTEYEDAFCTAHFEVPGEMFTLAMEAQNKGRGVVGSTSNILNFIKDKTQEASANGSAETLRFILGTEAGMITSIVRGVQELLAKTESKDNSKKPSVEIIFPVADDAIAEGGDKDMQIVPGVAGGEGCSTAGGCATCPFMKMNDLDSLFDVATRMNPVESNDPLEKFKPQQYADLIMGQSVSSVGVHPIMHMKDFMQQKRLSDSLVRDITTRSPGIGCPEAREAMS